jgi:hypothetical protein
MLLKEKSDGGWMWVSVSRFLDPSSSFFSLFCGLFYVGGVAVVTPLLVGEVPAVVGRANRHPFYNLTWWMYVENERQDTCRGSVLRFVSRGAQT